MLLAKYTVGHYVYLHSFNLLSERIIIMQARCVEVCHETSFLCFLDIDDDALNRPKPILKGVLFKEEMKYRRRER